LDAIVKFIAEGLSARTQFLGVAMQQQDSDAIHTLSREIDRGEEGD